MENNRISELTCTDRIRLCANIGVTCLTNTFDSIRLRIMCTSGIQSTVTIVHVTLIYPHINVTREEERTISPAQTGLHVQPTLTNPVLQLHLTAWLFESWEQTAFLSHPPFFTKQLSGEERESERMEGYSLLAVLTCADDLGRGSRVGKARLACTFHRMGRAIMGAGGIRIASTVVHQAAI